METYPRCQRIRNAVPFVGPALLAIVGVWLAGCACPCLKSDQAEAAESGSPMTQEFIYEEAPFPSCHASTIEETPEGLVSAWFGGTDEGEDDVGIWVSLHREGTWTTPVEVANGVQDDGGRHPCWNPVLFQASDGPLLLFYKVGPRPSSWWGMLTESRDGGRTWSAPRRLPEGIIGPVKNKPVLLDDGTLLCPSSTEHSGWTVHMEWTKDWGKTWSRTEPLNDPAKFGAIQPTILRHGGKRLQILCRSRQGVLTESWSEDNGRTWSPMRATALHNPSAGADGVTLKDGRHLLVYNPTKRGRSPLVVGLSEDGKAWRQVAVLEDEPGAEFSYPAVIQTADGRVHVTHTWKRRKIRHSVLDPAQLP